MGGYLTYDDITNKKLKSIKLEEMQSLLKNLTNQAPGVIYQYQLFPDGTICFPYASKGIYEIYEVTSEEAMNDASQIFTRIHPDDYDQFVKSFKKSANTLEIWRDTYRVLLPKQGEKWVEGRAKPEKLSDGSIVWYGNIRDITEEKKRESKIEYLSFHDTLTGLYNRRFFENELLRKDIKRQLPISIIIADINGLKIINDSLGHEKGDELLIKSAEILKSITRSEDVLARQGGDEFSILLPQTSKNQAEKIINRIKKASKETKTDELVVSIAIGIATKIESKQNIHDILKQADNNMYQNKLSESKNTKSKVVKSILSILEVKSYETKEHAMRMTKLSITFGKVLGLSNSELNQLSLLSTLHDIGKITIAEKILKKPGPLTEEEWEIIKKHPESGFRIANSSQKFTLVAEEIYSHHERWDGDGYPRGLVGEEIPLLARIITIVDSYDVMTNSRSYKEAISKKDALEEIKRCSGSQFDPNLSKEFVTMISE